MSDSPYDNPDGVEYVRRPCCGYVIHVDDTDDTDAHLADCEHASDWMKEDE